MLYRGKHDQTHGPGASCSQDASFSDEVSCVEGVDSGKSNVQLPAAESRSPGAAEALLEHGKLNSNGVSTQLHQGTRGADCDEGRALNGLSENVRHVLLGYRDTPRAH